jgi:hypothetical protein
MSLRGSKRGWSSSSEQASTTTTDAETMSTYMNAGESTENVKRAKAQVRSDHFGRPAGGVPATGCPCAALMACNQFLLYVYHFLLTTHVLLQECCSMDEAAPSFSFVWQHAVRTPLPGEHRKPETKHGWEVPIEAAASTGQVNAHQGSPATLDRRGTKRSAAYTHIYVEILKAYAMPSSLIRPRTQLSYCQ